MSGGLGSLEEMGVLATWDQDEGRGLPCESSCNIFMFSTMSGTTLPSLHTTVPVLYCVTPPSPMLPTCAPAAHAPDVTLPCTLAAHAPTSRPHTRCHSHAHWPPTHLMPPECTPAAHTPDTTRTYTGRPHTHQPPAYSLAVLVVVSADVAEVSSKGLHGQRAGDFSAPPLDNDACGGGDRSSVPILAAQFLGMCCGRALDQHHHHVLQQSGGCEEALDAVKCTVICHQDSVASWAQEQ